jgi:hypothetical protein
LQALADMLGPWWQSDARGSVCLASELTCKRKTDTCR